MSELIKSNPSNLTSLSEAERQKIRLQRFQLASTDINTMDSLKVIKNKFQIIILNHHHHHY